LFIWLTPHAPHSGPPADPDDRAAAGAFRGPNVAAKYRNTLAGQSLPQPPSFNEADVSDKPAAVRNRPLLTSQRIAAITEMYQQEGESLLSVDDAVKSVVDALRASGELDNTLIVFTDDNGFMHGEHRIPSGKVVVYEPSIRVPLVMRGPGISHGRHVADTVMNVDLAPTVLDAANVKPGLVVDGRSLLPLARDRLADDGRDVLLETPQYSAIRTDRYKYVEYRTGERELYDLKTDPNELQSRQDDPALARIRGELARRLAALRSCKGAACRQAPHVALNVSCASRSVRLRVSGADGRWVSVTRFYVNGRRIATDTKAPFSARTSRRSAVVRAHVATSDGRGVTLTRRVRCR
jgi:arylsulfatase A-like enzyme